MRKGFAHIILIILVLLLAAGAIFYFSSQGKQDNPKETNPISRIREKTTMMKDNLGGSKETSFTLVTEPKLIFTGGYADPTLSTLPDGKRIMYLNNFSVQPATYEAHTSENGLEWTKVATKLPNASTGRAVKFGEKTRLYYPDMTPIRPTDPPAAILSAISGDGLNFTNEGGTRVDPRDGYYLEGPTVFTLPDGTYKMYFSENETASAEKRISEIWGASSTDGLEWTRDGSPTIQATVADENIPSDWPQALHPFVLTRSDGTYLMFYNTHSEVFAATSNDGINWTKTGSVGIHGADVDGYYKEDGSIRLYYGDFSPETSGVVYTVDIKEN